MTPPSRPQSKSNGLDKGVPEWGAHVSLRQQNMEQQANVVVDNKVTRQHADISHYSSTIPYMYA
jgi:hypothetical protein